MSTLLPQIMRALLIVTAVLAAPLVSAEELQITFTGAVETSTAYALGTPVFATFDVNTLSGTTTNLVSNPNGNLEFNDVNNLAITNFAAAIGGTPFSVLPSASGRFVADDFQPSKDSIEGYEPGLTINNNVFFWDFLVNPPPKTITANTPDIVGTLILDSNEFNLGSIGDNGVSYSSVTIDAVVPATPVPEPDTLSLMVMAIAGTLGYRRLRRHKRIS